MTLRLVRDLSHRHRWGRWLVLDDGEPVGLVVESRDWQGGDYGGSTYGAATGDQWASRGHPTPAAALDALREHLGR